MKDFLDEVNDMNKGIWSGDETELDISEEICYDKGKLIRLKTGYVCFECNQNVLAYTQPYECQEHE